MPAIESGSAGIFTQRTNRHDTSTTITIQQRIPVTSHVHVNSVSLVRVSPYGTLLSKIGVKSERMAVKVTTLKKTSRDRAATGIAVKESTGGEKVSARADMAALFVRANARKCVKKTTTTAGSMLESNKLGERARHELEIEQ